MNLLSKSIDWFLYEGNNTGFGCKEVRVKLLHLDQIIFLHF